MMNFTELSGEEVRLIVTGVVGQALDGNVQASILWEKLAMQILKQTEEDKVIADTDGFLYNADLFDGLPDQE